MTRAELDKLAPLPWHRRGWDIFDADGHKISLTYQYVMDAIVEAVNAHYGEGNDKPVVPAAPVLERSNSNGTGA